MSKLKVPSLHPNFLTQNKPKIKSSVGNLVTRAKRLTKKPTFK